MIKFLAIVQEDVDPVGSGEAAKYIGPQHRGMTKGKERFSVGDRLEK